MSQLAGALGGGGGASLQASSSASSGPQSGTTGSVILDFGGINLGNQDIPLNANTTAASNAPPLLGSAAVSQASNAVLSYLPYVLLAGAAIFLFVWARKKL